jgi:hypothetical protein
MKLLLSAAFALLGLALVACGEAHKSDTTVSAVNIASGDVSAFPSRLKDDEDWDGSAALKARHNGNGADADDDSYSDSYYDFDDENVLDYGHAANAADTQAITLAVRRYYVAAARGEGPAVCGLLSLSVARAVPEEYGQIPGSPALHGKTCATVMPGLLKQLHPQMTVDNAALKIGIVRVEGATGQVLLGFGAVLPNRYTVLRREQGAWKIVDLTANGLP